MLTTRSQLVRELQNIFIQIPGNTDANITPPERIFITEIFLTQGLLATGTFINTTAFQVDSFPPDFLTIDGFPVLDPTQVGNWNRPSLQVEIHGELTIITVNRFAYRFGIRNDAPLASSNTIGVAVNFYYESKLSRIKIPQRAISPA